MTQRTEADGTTMPLEPVEQVDDATQGRQRLRRRSVALALLLLIPVVAVLSAGWIGLREGPPSALDASRARHDAGTMGAQAPQESPAPQEAPASMQPPFMPDTPGPDKPAVPSGHVGSTPFPKSLDSQPGMLHHSGGPYVSAAQVRDRVAQHLNCGSTHPLRQCDEVIVKFFTRYEDATNAHPTGGAFASGLASDREVFLVTVKGQLDMTGSMRGARTNLEGPIIVSHWNYTVDATTGTSISGGTAGDILSASG